MSKRDDLDLEQLLEDLDGIDLEDLDFDVDEEEGEVDVDFEEPLEEESEPVEVEEEPVPTAKKESKSKRKPRKKEAKEKATEPVEEKDGSEKAEPQYTIKEVTVNHPVPATALDLISAALDLRKNQIAEAKLTPDAKDAAMEQIDYAKQVISLFLYG
jgi:hypothetical protein